MEKLLRPETVASVLDVKVTTVRRWLREGKMRGVKWNQGWRVPESALQEPKFQNSLLKEERRTLRAEDTTEEHNQKVRALLTAPRAVQEAAFAAASEAATIYYASEEGRAETQEWQSFDTETIEYSEADLATA